MNMNCQHAIELLPWLINGSLDGEEGRLTRKHLAGCEECRREAGEAARAWEVLTQHITSLALAEYAQGLPPSALEPKRIERHLALCPACRQELEWATTDRVFELATVRQARAGAASQPGRSSGAGVRSVRWRSIAVAASLTALVASGGLIRDLGERDQGKRDVALSLETTASATPMAQPTTPAWQTGSSIFGDGFESGSTLKWTSSPEASAGGGSDTESPSTSRKHDQHG